MRTVAEDWLPALDFPAYLESKRAIDAASLNPALFDNFRAWYEAEPAPRLLDLGTGTGAMLRRVLEFRTAGDALLSGLDSDPMSLESAAVRIRSQLESAGLQVRVRRAPGRWELEAEGRGRRLGVRLVRGDLLDADPAMLSGLGSHDLVTAHAFLDLLPVERGLRTIRSLLRPGGLLYATLNYDGLTVLLPADSDELFERSLLAAYDQSMEARRLDGEPTAGAFSGRRFYGALGPAGFEVLGAGSSDWNVFPAKGRYAEGNALFLKSLLGMIAAEGLRSNSIEPAALRAWYRRRVTEVDAGRLGLVVHQLDLLACRKD
jgi:SAM-dependent methyltransferase